MGAAPIIKNGIHKAYCKLNTKGETPIEKNIIVVDEQGKIYEATYPKRAKGLVKNGRACFVAENKICLACPPNENLEDNKMSENTNINIEQNTNQITAREILEQIKNLQEQLVSLKETQNSLFAADTIDEYEDGQLVRSVNCELVESQLEAIKTVFHEREKTLNSLLDFYKNIYNDVYEKEKKQREEKIELIKSLQLSVIDRFSQHLDKDELTERMDTVYCRIDALCTDILCDKI